MTRLERVSSPEILTPCSERSIAVEKALQKDDKDDGYGLDLEEKLLVDEMVKVSEEGK